MSINPPRRRSAAYRIPGVCALALLGGAGIWAAHRSEHEFTATSVITPSPRALLSLQTGSADLDVSGWTGTSIRIERRVHWIGERPTHSVRELNGRLQLDDDCGGGIFVPVAMFSFHDSCSISYRVKVPAGQAIKLQAGSGEIFLHNLAGRISADAGSGDVSAIGLRTSAAQLSTGSGDLSASFDRQPTSVRAQAGSGDVSVRVPGGSYRITVSTGSGDNSIDQLVSNPASKRSITARTGSGDVSIGRSDR
jgi:hypothetical protein